jgi:hypothetical protein
MPKKKIIEDENYRLYFRITQFYDVLYLKYEETIYFMHGKRLFGGKKLTYENTISAVFWEEIYTLPDHIDINNWVQVVANRSIRKQIYINAEDVIYQFRLLG